MFHISFDFDEVTKKVTNLQVTSPSKANLDEAEIQVLDNKIRLTPKAIQLIGAVPGDRISINYWTVDNQLTFPVIAKSEVFTDKDNGTKLTKSSTISFRGNQRTTLLIYGKLFKLEPFKDGMFRLVRIEDGDVSISQEETDLEDLNASEIDAEIQNIMSQADDDQDLPF